ncbi:MAG: hypothetical protein L3J93_06430 [Thermoplasmata archaeon]|nr:hypothetical protein [Thermoplasmata archaeon]
MPIAGLAVVIQFVLGMWTNVYGPAGGFTSNTSFPALDWHYMVGDILGVLAILVVIFSVVARRKEYIGLSVVVLAAVLVAGFAGAVFVGSTPNNPTDSIVMALAFLVAFAGLIAYGFFLRGFVPGPMTAVAA